MRLVWKKVAKQESGITQMSLSNELEVALSLVDSLIKECSGRDIVSASQMTDSLLDIRIHLMGIAEREKSENA